VATPRPPSQALRPSACPRATSTAPLTKRRWSQWILKVKRAKVFTHSTKESSSCVYLTIWYNSFLPNYVVIRKATPAVVGQKLHALSASSTPAATPCYQTVQSSMTGMDPSASAGDLQSFMLATVRRFEDTPTLFKIVSMFLMIQSKFFFFFVSILFILLFFLRVITDWRIDDQLGLEIEKGELTTKRKFPAPLVSEAADILERLGFGSKQPTKKSGGKICFPFFNFKCTFLTSKFINTFKIDYHFPSISWLFTQIL
jgi:hypothetical protein